MIMGHVAIVNNHIMGLLSQGYAIIFFRRLLHFNTAEVGWHREDGPCESSIVPWNVVPSLGAPILGETGVGIDVPMFHITLL